MPPSTVSVLRDDNNVPVWYGVSCVDGETPVEIAVNSSNGGIKLDYDTVISFTPDPSQATIRDANGVPVKTGVSSTDDTVILPLYVNPANGAVLAEM